MTTSSYQLPDSISATLIRTVAVTARRERRVYATTGSRGRAVMMRDFKRGARGEMQSVGAPFFIFDREAPEMLATLGEAVAAIGGSPHLRQARDPFRERPFSEIKSPGVFAMPGFFRVSTSFR